MSGLVGGAVVPTAPLVLEVASPDQPDDVRDTVTRVRVLARAAIEALPEVDVHILVSAGPRGIYDRARASLAGLGMPDAEIELPVAGALVEELSRLSQYPMFRDGGLDVGLSVLALQLHAGRGEVEVLALNTPPGADFEVLTSIGASVHEALHEVGERGAIVVAGDLSAGLGQASPAYAIDGASAWDEAVVRAARSGGLEAIRELGPEEADRVGAVGWAPLATLHGACAAGHLGLEVLGYETPRGVGQLVARCRPDGPPAGT